MWRSGVALAKAASGSVRTMGVGRLDITSQTAPGGP
jgi:hypothetical protein